MTLISSNQTKQLIAAQERSTRAIVAAEFGTQAQVAAMRTDVQAVSEGIQMLTDVLDWGLADIAAKLDAQSKLLQQAVAALESPRTTYANEARRMGIERFQLGWYDEAAKEFRICLEANGTDFLAHLFLGIIALSRSARPEALEYALRSAKYARPYSAEWAAFAWAMAARVNFLQQDYPAALQAAREAIQLDASAANAYYEISRVMAALVAPAESIQALQTAIILGPIYYDMATLEPAFTPQRAEVAGLQQALLEASRSLGEETIQQGNVIKQVARKAKRATRGESVQPLKKLEAQLAEMRPLIARSSYVNTLVLLAGAKEALRNAARRVDSAIESKIRAIRFADKPSERESAIFGNGRMIALTFGLIGFISGMVCFIAALLGGSITFVDLLVVPLVVTVGPYAFVRGIQGVIDKIDERKRNSKIRKLEQMQAPLKPML